MRKIRVSGLLVWLAAAAACAASGFLLACDRAPDRPASRAAASDRSGSPAGFRDRAHLVEHFRNHGGEFGGIGIDEYLRRAQALRDAPVGNGVLEAVRADGVVTRFDRTTGCFGAYGPDGTIRTFFRPNDGEAYFRRQARRAREER